MWFPACSVYIASSTFPNSSVAYGSSHDDKASYLKPTSSSSFVFTSTVSASLMSPQTKLAGLFVSFLQLQRRDGVFEIFSGKNITFAHPYRSDYWISVHFCLSNPEQLKQEQQLAC